MQDSEKRKAIEKFLLDIDVLDDIESRLANFNVFETLGIVNTEIRHSNVLSWLLNPKENHGLGDTYIKKFMQEVFYHNQFNLTNSNITLLDISLMDYYTFYIRREWRNIDLLAFSEEHKIVMVIENKIWSKESKHQLKKYMEIVSKEFPSYSKVFLFLTPNGDTPSDEENWLTIDYNYILNTLEKTVALRKDSISQSVSIFITQYIEVLRRYIVGENELERICKEIYSKHQKALDLIFEYKPDTASEIGREVHAYLENHSFIIKDKSNKRYIRFTTKPIDMKIEKEGSGWTSTNRIFLFELQNYPDKILMKAIIGPGEQIIREKIHFLAESKPKLFNKAKGTLSGQYNQIYSKELVSRKYYEENDVEAVKDKVIKELDKFISKDMAAIEKEVVDHF
ncbi:PD-(D/E)XK nuclease family protein [Pseudalkalibacillus caeni]|uniref:PD-(D/E)XK nuclease superfamily protein n=1 Tax=Exobacillus caeni TaxID=2574798 RepID=A0A5R9F1Y2_9BACL|nr:PD-(D/E)XK nuclease family protein [Pseudalkalibacillus caeni]TLS36480.1 hypothetical protein FCL54_14790 [Pseudalkalibacillus caeni]